MSNIRKLQALWSTEPSLAPVWLCQRLGNSRWRKSFSFLPPVKEQKLDSVTARSEKGDQIPYTQLCPKLQLSWEPKKLCKHWLCTVEFCLNITEVFKCLCLSGWPLETTKPLNLCISAFQGSPAIFKLLNGSQCPIPDRKLILHGCPMPSWQRRQREEAKAPKGKLPKPQSSPPPHPSCNEADPVGAAGFCCTLWGTSTWPHNPTPPQGCITWGSPSASLAETRQLQGGLKWHKSSTWLTVPRADVGSTGGEGTQRDAEG